MENETAESLAGDFLHKVSEINSLTKELSAEELLAFCRAVNRLMSDYQNDRQQIMALSNTVEAIRLSA